MSQTIRIRCFLVIAMAFIAPLTACSVNPATGKRQFNIVGEQQEVAMGLEAAPQFTRDYGGPIPSSDIRNYISDIGMTLARVSERTDLPWEFTCVDSAVINAFALPGGKVFMSRGLLAQLDNEAQLAGVLGHEIGHITAQHIGQQMSHAMGLQVVLAGLSVASSRSNNEWVKVLGVGAQTGGSVYLLKFGRDQESEADALGMRYMSRVGYNPAAQMQVMQILQKASQGGGRQPEFLSTHPYPETRIARIEQALRTEYSDYENLNKYAFHHERFKSYVLDPLKTLPSPRHTGQESQASASKNNPYGLPSPALWCMHCQQDTLARADH